MKLFRKCYSQNANKRPWRPGNCESEASVPWHVSRGFKSWNLVNFRKKVLNLYNRVFRVKKSRYDSPRKTLLVLGESPSIWPKTVKLTIAKRRANQRTVDGSMAIDGVRWTTLNTFLKRIKITLHSPNHGPAEWSVVQLIGRRSGFRGSRVY